MAEIVDIAPDEALEKYSPTLKRDALASWVMSRVQEWITHRDGEGRQQLWEEYYRLWRGLWSPADKNRDSERSRIITPALQQAVEAVTSEIESAILDKSHWFDIEDDYEAPAGAEPGEPTGPGAESAAIVDLRKKLRDDINEADFETAMNQIFLNGSIFGTGIGKLVVDEEDILTLRQGANMQAELDTTTKVLVRLVPVMPQQFAIDSSAHNIKDALGVAHCYTSPEHLVEAMQQSGSYYKTEVCGAPPEDALISDENPDYQADTVNITDYHGLVPRGLLRAAQEEAVALAPDTEIVDLGLEPADEDGDNDDDLVEAMVVIGNGGVLLKAVENPTLTKERLFIAYRHEIVPDQFWGRGVCEKGYNSQKALDASMRGRLDGLALTVHPMMGIDSTRMPRGFKFAVRPGRSILTTGNPGEVLQPMSFGNMDPNQFTNTSELERMVSMSTGGFDTAAPVEVNNRNETASGMSMMLGGFVKRSKRTIRNIENEFIIPMVQKVSRLYMQFAPERYPARDVTFKAMSVLGTMARELEQNQFSSMMSTVPPDSPAFWMLLRSVFESSQLSNREEMVMYTNQQLQQALNPPAPPPDPLVELRRMEVLAKVRAENARIQVEYIRAQAEIARAANDARLAESKEAKIEADAILSLAKAAGEELGNQFQQYSHQLAELERNAATTTEGLAENVIQRAGNTGLGINP